MHGSFVVSLFLILLGLLSETAQPESLTKWPYSIDASATEDQRTQAFEAIRLQVEANGVESEYSAIEYLVSRSDLPAEWRADVLYDFVSSVRAAGHGAMREPLIKLVERLTSELPPGRERSWMLEKRGNLELDLGRFAEAEALYFASEVEAAERSLTGRANLMVALGVARAQQGDFDGALEAMLEAYARYEKTEEGPSANLLRNIGALSIYLEDFERAVDFSRQAIEAFGPEHPSVAGVYSNLAAALVELERTDEAMASLEEGIAIAERQRRPNASLLNNLGYLLREQGLLQDALEQFEITARLNREEDDAGSLAITEKNIGETLIALGRREEAADRLSQSLALYRESDIKPKRLELYPVMIENQRVLGRFEDARTLLLEWRDLADDLAVEHPDGEIVGLESAVELERHERELAEAERDWLVAESARHVAEAERSRGRLTRGVMVVAPVVLLLIIWALWVRRSSQRALALKKAELDRQRKALALNSARLKLQGSSDDLTGLGNRRSIRHLLDQDLNHRVRQAPGILIRVDLDRLKDINQQFSYAVGDRVIALFADLLAEVAVRDDLLVRWGGDSFLWLVADSPMVRAPARCQDLRRVVRRNRITADEERIDISCSIGAAPVDLSGPDPYSAFELSMKVAGAALHKVKQEWPGGWAAYERRSDEAAPFKGTLDLDRLIDNGLLVRIED